MTSISNSIRKVYQYAEPNLTLVGWMGLLGFPTYYYVWSYLFPQPYESLRLRIACSALFAVLALRSYVPKHLERYLPHYYFFAIGICLPYFFSYMMFMNHWSTIWAMSFMASIFLHVLLVHQTSLMLFQATIAISLAYLSAYGLDTQYVQQEIVWAYVPIFLFTYIFGNLFYFRNQVEHESKVSLAKSFGAGMAHEMRNPLSALKASLDVLSSLLPEESARHRSGYKLSAQEVALAREVIADADEVISTGNETIDLLLTSIDENRVSRSTFRKHSIRDITNNALSSYPYRSLKDKKSVSISEGGNFDFFGSDALIKYALYNLLKNAFYYQNNEQFNIVIELRSYERHNELTFTDNGVGISPQVIDHIFNDFYTVGKTGSYGLGLPFCRKVMKALGGSVSCRSRLGEWTEFTLMFPKYDSIEVSKIKQDLMKSKSVLYIGEQTSLMHQVNQVAFYKDFQLTVLALSTASRKEEYEFEYDLILVDLDSAIDEPHLLTELESKLHFTEGRIAFLYDKNSRYHNDIERHLTVFPIEKHRMMLEAGAILDQLFFEDLEPNRNLLPRKQFEAGKTIVVADDNQSLRFYTSLFLEQQGFTVLQASNGQQVLDELAQKPVDLIIMDLEMPQLDGLETTSVIRASQQQYASVPILAHTGNSSEGVIAQIHQAGMNDYIIKPAPTEKLLDKIANWI